MNARSISALLAALLAFGTAAWSQDAAGDVERRRRDTISYGIESEIVELLKTLRSERDGRYDGDLGRLLETTRSRKLGAELLSYFSEVGWKGAEEKAVSIVDGRDGLPAEYVKAALQYLVAVKSAKGLGEAAEIIDAAEQEYLPHAVRIFGAAGGPAEATRLVEMYDADDWTETVRIEIIRALGDIRAPEAVERLARLLEDGSAGKVLRMNAADALAKIGDERAKAAVLKAAFDEDPNVRTQAVEALGAFQGRDVEDAIVECLRDSFGKTRIAAAKAAGKRKLASALPHLKYKATSDPDRAVRETAFRAIAEIGTAEAFAFLREFLTAPKNEQAFRSMCFGLLGRNDPGSRGPLMEQLESAIAAKDQTFFKAIAREIVGIDGDPAVPFVERLLAHADFTIRLGALDWIKRNGNRALIDRVRALSESDPAEAVRKKAKQVLEDI